MSTGLSYNSSPAMLAAPPYPSAILSPRRNLKSRVSARANGIKSCFVDPIREKPIIKEALKEPVAFMGGMLAGLLRIDLNEDPLKEWVTRTVEASGVTPEEIHAAGENRPEETPQPIDIE
ncbi:unnamed protein product [Cuscuta campestris]|uniref:Uncharacterized protein n=1 Tax=Cuscuta campestris TaxID=132261 RepID=A0A484MF35_9ASTE|nr:unnamed protein product [Cuscuta campestris]